MKINDKEHSWLIYPNGNIDVIEFTHYEFLEKKFADKIAAYIGLSSLEACEKVEDELLKNGYMRFGMGLCLPIKSRYYCMIWKLGEKEKQTILDFCRAIVELNQSEIEKAFVIYQKCSNIRPIMFYIKDIINDDYLQIDTT
jgi:hypothetical protein